MPPLNPFTGEGKITEEDSFEWWLEHFEERAGLAGWSEAQKLHQLKLLLEKTALNAFRVFAKEDKETYEKAKAALKNRFWSVDIEGWNFTGWCRAVSQLRPWGWKSNDLVIEPFRQ